MTENLSNEKEQAINPEPETNIARLQIGDREIILIGTAHISQESVAEVNRVIDAEKPDRICVEIDEARYNSMQDKNAWSKMNIFDIIKQKKIFLMMANLVLASFQRRMGLDIGIKPGEEMVAAIKKAEELAIPFSLCDRNIQITLRRAWAKTNFWGKNKMLAALLSAAFSKEKLSPKEIEELKKKHALENMLEEMARYLPTIKKVLIDERDIYLATNIFKAEGKKLVAVVGAGHIPGMVRILKELAEEKKPADLTILESIPRKKSAARFIAWIIPALILTLIIFSFVREGTPAGINKLSIWVLANGSLAALGSLLALAHPLTILVAFVAAPFTSLIPVIGVGLFTGLTQAFIRKPQVQDFETLQQDISKFSGFYKNKFIHIILVYFLSSLGSMIGTFIGAASLTATFGKFLNDIGQWLGSLWHTLGF